MQPLEIIGQVAARRIAAVLQTPGTRALFGIMGLRPDVTTAIARDISLIPNVGPVEVFLHSSLREGDVGNAKISTATATWHRNHPATGVRATIFSVPAAQIRAVEQSLGHVVRIDEKWLLERPQAWAYVSLAHSLDETRDAMANVLAGLLQAGLLVTPMILARFCSRVASTMQEGSMLENAVREALPALRLPRNAGDGKARFSADITSAREFFSRLRQEAQPYLYRRTKEGETVASGELRRKLAELEANLALSKASASIVEALADDKNIREGQWSPAQEAVAELGWDELAPVFAQARKTEKPSFGEETRRLFDQEFRNTLDDDEKSFLDGLKTDGAKPGPKIDSFFEKHRDRLKKNPTLYRRWEKLIYKKPIEVQDLGEGLLRLIDQVCAGAEPSDGQRVYIWLRGSEQASFWANEKLRPQLLYLRDRYRGLPEMLEPEIVLDFGQCWAVDWEHAQVDGASGTNTIEFEAFLVSSSELPVAKPGKIQQPAARGQMIWKPVYNAIGYSLPLDLRHILPASAEQAWLLTGTIAENRRGRRGATGIDLEEAGSVIDAHGQSQGSLANPARPDNLVCKRFECALGELERDKLIDEVGAEEVRAQYLLFKKHYSDAIDALICGEGIGSHALCAQAQAYGDLFEALREHAASEPGLRELVAPLLDIGSIRIEGARDASITAGWHPLRLAEIWAKAAQLADTAKAIIHANVAQRTGAEDFLQSRIRNLAGTYYGDIGWSGGTKPKLLAETQRALDCSLLEEAEGEGLRNIGEEGAKEAVAALQLISQNYLELRPHERSNFSIALLNAESDDIPVQLSRSLARLVDEDPDLRCDLVITHEDPQRLRDLFESQNRRMAGDLDGSGAADLSRSFIARLRVSLLSPDRLVAEAGRKGSDLALLQDVIAQSATIRWKEGEAIEDPVDLRNHMPTSRSKRLPFGKRSVHSGLYLTAPVQPKSVIAWSNAIHDLLVGENSTPTGPWLPLRWVQFDDSAIQNQLERAHQLANWVVTFDRIADRRLIVQDDRRIIRYFSTPNSSHNVIVSAEITSNDLGDRLNSDLAKLLPNATVEERDQILRRVHAIAARLSGAVVMRAAQWRNFAQELLGLILAERRLEGLFGATTDRATAWFYLDDNRSWLDLKGEMADILAVNFTVEDGEPVIQLVVAEAKYCTASNIPQHSKHSLRQLEATYTELHRRLLQPETSLDPSVWTNRIADMILEQMDPFDTVGGMSQGQWIEALRQQSVRIEVSGHSMIFSEDLENAPPSEALLPDETLSPEERRPLAQWVHGRSEVTALLQGLGKGEQPPDFPLPTSWGRGGGLAVPTATDETDVAPKTELVGGHALAEGSVAPITPSTHPLELINPDDERSDSGQGLVAHDVSSPDTSVVTNQEGPVGWPSPIGTVLRGMSHVADQVAGEEWLSKKVRDLQNALHAEGMDAPIIESRLTPNSGLVYVGARTLTVAWLERRQVDLLTKHSIDIVRISPMPGSIAVAIRRPERSVLHLADAWLRRAPGADPSIVERFAPLVGEKEDDGRLLYLPLAGEFAGQERCAPHSLVSGNTGSGKGILVTNLMLDLCALNAPEDIDIYLIDPKRGVDYAWARRLPHLRGGIVSDQDEAVDLLEKLVAEMEDRYELISERGFRNVDQFNRKVALNERLPRVIIFFDEVANWMQDDDFKKQVESLLNKIATKARAAGLHLFMVYQRADVQVMTMQLRTNLGNRLILRLPDEGSSKIALGEKGAERLLGKGHLIAKLDSDEKIYAQVPFIGDDEVEELVDAIAATWNGIGQSAE
jgi:S-DNA-T family DNA segregation ATPase FtsK/SpoIIIE